MKIYRENADFCIGEVLIFSTQKYVQSAMDFVDSLLTEIPQCGKRQKNYKTGVRRGAAMRHTNKDMGTQHLFFTFSAASACSPVERASQKVLAAVQCSSYIFDVLQQHTMYIHTFLAYPLVSDEFVFHDSTVVLIDVLRASTTICHALYNGAREVIPMGELEHAVRLSRTMSSETTLLGGERKGLKPHGFTLGNSPLEYTAETVQQKSVILTTTNGTQALAKVRHTRCLLVGAFVNLTALTAFVRSATSNTERLFLLCAGNNGDFSYEDMLCAGAITRQLADTGTVEISDATKTALTLFDHTKPLIAKAVESSQHAVYLDSIGFGQDIHAALDFDSCPIVPLLEGSSFKAA